MLSTPKNGRKGFQGRNSSQDGGQKKARREAKPRVDDPRVREAADLLALKGPMQKLTTPMAMRACGCLPEEAANTKHRNRVERMRDKPKRTCESAPKDVSTTTADKASFPSPVAMPTGLSGGRSRGLDASAAAATAPSLPVGASVFDNSGLKPLKEKTVKADSVQAAKLKRRRHNRRRHKSKALKTCCLGHKDSRDRKLAGEKNTPSSETVCDEVNALMSTSAAPRSVRRHVAANKAGESPLPMGPSSNQGLDNAVFSVLLRTFESHFRIDQCNGESFLNERPVLTVTSNAVVEPVWPTEGPNLLRRCLNNTATDTKALVDDCREERRVRWTTHSSIKSWFTHWRKDLAELGFGAEGSTGFDVPEAQLRRIINLDETALSLDGGVGGRGGQPAVTFMDPSLPNPGTPATESGTRMTMITGSSACGEPLPPHHQFPCGAKDDSRKKLKTELTDCLHDTVAAFGHRDEAGNHKERPWACTLGMNEKGGMDPEQFELRMNNSIIPLFPDAADVKGLRVLVKLDLGPGRMNCELLADLRHGGFCVHPSVPSTQVKGISQIRS